MSRVQHWTSLHRKMQHNHWEEMSQTYLKWNAKKRVFHLFFLKPATLTWLVLSPWNSEAFPWLSSATCRLTSCSPCDLSFPLLLSFPPLSRAKLPVLLLFLTRRGTRELGDSIDDKERLLSVSDNCSMLPGLLELCKVSVEPWQLVWTPLIGWRSKAGLWVSVGSPLFGSCDDETLKLSPSSMVVCRLPSKLPVARDESLWDAY